MFLELAGIVAVGTLPALVLLVYLRRKGSARDARSVTDAPGSTTDQQSPEYTDETTAQDVQIQRNSAPNSTLHSFFETILGGNDPDSSGSDDVDDADDR